ncbi:hypothetical protein Bca101_065516 [Brassica carinata]
MQRRLTSAEKGKGIALSAHEPPRKARVRVEELINQDLVNKHALTLIGRITNPSVQKVGSLIPFFTEHWNTTRRPRGSDLGLGMFQFHFETETDLLAVLEKRPYHFAKWMIILQRWEPTISPSFPSLIPFWIKIQGVPVHLWTESVARGIGEDIGIFDAVEISEQAIKMRVQVNGRLPLIKTSVLEFPNGEELKVSLVYEKLEKHCSQCNRLDHELKDCLEAKFLKREKAALETEQSTDIAPRGNLPTSSLNSEKRFQQSNSDVRRAGGPIRRTPYRKNHDVHHEALDGRRHHSHSRESHTRHPYNQRQEWRKKGHGFYEDHRQGDIRFRGDSLTNSNSNRSKDRESDRYQRDRTPIARRLSTHQEEPESPKSLHSHPVRGSPLREERPKETNLKSPPERISTSHRLGLATTPVASPINQQLLSSRERIPATSRIGPRSPPMIQQSEISPKERTPATSRLGPVSLSENIQSEKSSKARIPASSRLGPISPPGIQISEASPPGRIPVSSRIGPLNQETPDLPEPVQPAATKRKPGRPAGSRKVQASPAKLSGTISRKRKIQQSKPPNLRRKLVQEPTSSSDKGKGLKQSSRGTRRGDKQPISQQNSDDQPIWSPEATLTNAIAAAKEWDTKGLTEKVSSRRPPRVAWPQLRITEARIRSDGAWRKEDGAAGLGWTIQRLGQTSSAQLFVKRVNSPLVAEGLALREALISCKELEFKTITVKNDSSILIKAACGLESFSELHGILADIKKLSCCFDSVCFNWIPRDQNVAADKLAKDALFVGEAFMALTQRL